MAEPTHVSPTHSLRRPAPRRGRQQERQFIAVLFGFFFVALMIANGRSLKVANGNRRNSKLNESEDDIHFNSNPLNDEDEDSRRQLLKVEQQQQKQQETLKCAPWDVDMDGWWQSHPNWESHEDNATHTCFRLIPDPRRAAFLRQLCEVQYHQRDCSRVKIRNNIGVGFAAALVRMIVLFFYHGCTGVLRFLSE